MTVILIKRGNLDTDPCTGRLHVDMKSDVRVMLA